jgi:pimeloyl-ACP methyl ester carboxylesterase
MGNWRDGFVETNGIRMHYWRTGDGSRPPVVLSHGATDSGLCWSRTARALESDYDVIMVDARGHGLSDKPAEDYGPRQSAADLAGLIRGLGIERPHLIGHSMGGEISANCAADFPELPRSLVVIDSGFISNAGPYRGSAEQAAERIAQSRARMIETQALGLDGLIARCREESPGWHEEELQPWAESKLQVSPEYGRFFAQEKRPWQKIFAAIQCPMLLLVAEPHLDSHSGWDAAVQATGIWRDGQLIHIAGAGHNVQRDRWEAFMARITAWMAAH